MLNYCLVNASLVNLIGIIFTFFATFFALKYLMDFLPHDQGRAFAVDGAKSAGKPRGAGIIFVFTFVIGALLVTRISIELVIYLLLVVAEMFTGYFDDAAEKPWGELIKGILDMCVALVVAGVYIKFNGCEVNFAVFDATVKFNPILFAILTVVLVWASINVTNCSDGVDGLSATLTTITLASIYILDEMRDTSDDFKIVIVLFIIALLAYLWFNSTPSKLLMGDAGSRAMGVFIAIAILKSQSPFMYLLFAIVLILDGGLGLVKVTLIRTIKINIMKNITTPLHDHARKKMNWSNTQVVMRLAIIQIMVSALALYLVNM
ncbi:phospho-N-acetylmuramoyl-pentapeptide-transferase [Lachnobacterium bovis]|uniref:Phospho-N-acetylmuramoyl-pentapeptide-transferase n=1 Tax=Lachnobacterium bovis TaxID=140626 RepID=A0A1H9PE88_9FIRM|nr:phospho-N-acetylmuramoyl-pentapeptide-transferase [Lachnobacterium bovis]SER46458.1 phospho-N-acetylmuramoyl-pentapeptide-transferase [Lachnobacterium bovis]